MLEPAPLPCLYCDEMRYCPIPNTPANVEAVASEAAQHIREVHGDHETADNIENIFAEAVARMVSDRQC